MISAVRWPFRRARSCARASGITSFIQGKDDLVVPYEVKLGVRSGDGYYEVISGLKAGERVVTSANFLIDSESSLKAALKSAAGAGTHQH